jgi:hypothetical protein
MYEVLAFSAFLTSVAFFLSSFAVFWPEYRAAQKRDAAEADVADTEGMAGMTGTAGTAGMAGTVGTTGIAGASGAEGNTGAEAGFWPGDYPGCNPVGPEDMKRYRFNSCPAQEEEEETEVLALTARH